MEILFNQLGYDTAPSALCLEAGFSLAVLSILFRLTQVTLQNVALSEATLAPCASAVRVSISVVEMLRFAQHDTIRCKPIKVNLNNGKKCNTANVQMNQRG